MSRLYWQGGKVKLVSETPGNGGSIFKQLFQGGMGVMTQATGNSDLSSFWFDQMTRTASDAAANNAVASQAVLAWKAAERDVLLGTSLGMDPAALSREVDALAVLVK